MIKYRSMIVLAVAAATGLAFCQTSHAQTDKNEVRLQRMKQLMERLDANNDSVISRDEVPEKMRERFARMDLNENGEITAEEFRQVMRRMAMAGKKGNARGQGKGNRRQTDRPNDNNGEMDMSRDRKMKGKRRGKGADAEADGVGGKRDRKGKARGKGNAKGKDQGSANGNTEARSARKGKGRRSKKNQPQDMESMVARAMGALDQNKDGVISRDEAPKRLEQNWQRFDKNGNDQLDGEEIETLRRMLRSQQMDKGMKDRRGAKKSFEGVKPKRPGSGGGE